jgi:hypothetical protein
VQHLTARKLPAHAGWEALMKLEVYDPAMCCSTGVCGPEVDPQLVSFAADAHWLEAAGVTVRRFNLSQEPTAFMANALVRRTLQSDGVSCLPLGVLEGEVVFSGAYPDRAALARLLQLTAEDA